MAKKRVYKHEEKTVVNDSLEKFEKIQEKVSNLKAQQENIIKNIREGLSETVVVFIDMVDSTQFKTDCADEPEKWIYRVKLFSEIISEYVEQYGGKVVKYIGDEVMATFVQKPNPITSAIPNLYFSIVSKLVTIDTPFSFLKLEP